PSAAPYVTDSITLVPLSFNEIVSLSLFNESVAVNTRPFARALPNSPAGVPPPKITATSLAGMIVPGGKVNRTLSASLIVNPPTLAATLVRLMTSTNSSCDELVTPSPFASPAAPSGGSARYSLIPTPGSTVNVFALEPAGPGFSTVTECGPGTFVTAAGIVALNRFAF